MVKDINYIIKRILIGVGICLILSLIRGNLILKANAKVLVNNNQLSYNNYLVLQPGSSQFHFYDDTIYQDISVFPQYFVLNMCTDSQDVNSWSVANNSLTNVNFYNTKISCTFPNSTYTGGHIMYIYGQVNPNTSCNSSLVSCYQNGYINFTVPNRSSWALLSYQLSKDVINIDYGSNTIINQNQMILSGQQSIINNQNQNAQDIINNQNQNAQDIIDNQNTNTEKEIESQKACTFIDNANIVFDNSMLNGWNNNGTVLANNSYGITDYISVAGADFIPFVPLSLSESSSGLCFYNINKSVISCIRNTTLTLNNKIIIPSNASFVRFSINKNLNEPQFKYCTNGNQAIVDSQNSINNSLNDDSGVNDSDIGDLFGDIRGNSSSPVSDLLTLPITLLQAYLDGMSGSCSPYNLGTLYGTSLILPCIDIPGIIGTNLWNVVDALFCLYMIYNIAMMCISIYESFTSLDDSMQLLYSPQHSGHTRVSRNEGDY